MYIDVPSVEITAKLINDGSVPVLSGLVGLFGVLTLTAIVAAVIVGVCVCRNKNTKGT